MILDQLPYLTLKDAEWVTPFLEQLRLNVYLLIVLI